MKITQTKVVGLGINLKEECDQCTYCWGQDINKRFHPKRVASKIINHKYDELLDQLESNKVPKPFPEKECQFYDRNQWDIILSSQTDAFHKDVGNTPQHVLNILKDYPEIARRVRILSKRDYRNFIPYMHKEMLLGVTITTLDENERELYQPRTSSITKLIGTLTDAHKSGFKTWLVIEPFFSGMNAILLVRTFLPFLDEVWIGRLNHKSKDEYNVPLDSEIIRQYRAIYKWAKQHAPQMRVRLKKQLLELL